MVRVFCYFNRSDYCGVEFTMHLTVNWCLISHPPLINQWFIEKPVQYVSHGLPAYFDYV